MAEMLSQEEIDALLNGGPSADSGADEESHLTPEEVDAIGEIGNISMGTAATTLFMLLNQKVTITTPKVSETTLGELSGEFVDPSVLIYIKYVVGIEGTNLLILNESDVKIITDLMMGGDGTNVADELTDLHLSAIGEAMNQMIGSSSTSLSEMLKEKIDISPPEAFYEKVGEIDLEGFGMTMDEPLVKIAFKLTVGNLIDSEIMQILPVDVVRQMIKGMTSEAPAPIENIPDIDPITPPPQQQQAVQQQVPPVSQQVPPMHQQAPPMYQQAPPMQQAMPQMQQENPINAQAVEFQSFDENFGQMYYNNDIGIIRDVPLEITVELGRTSKKINEILDFGVGTVIELDKLVGEPLDILANGKKIAKGEVVVVDENYGIRITDIIIPGNSITSI